MGARLALMMVCVTSLLLAIWFPSALAQNSVQDYLDAHNAARAEVGVGPMRWDDDLAKYALDYATSQRGTCPSLIHSGGPYGENLSGGKGEFTARQGVDLWVKEKQFYDYGSNTCRGGQCLHYTQVVWRDSVRLGCARVRCSDNTTWYVICSYAPRGNIQYEWPY